MKPATRPSTIASILLHVDATPASAGRLELACTLAERFGATVRVVFGTAAALETETFGYAAGAGAAEAAAELEQLRRAELQGELQRSVQTDGLDVRWFDVSGDAITPAFVREAAFADLVIVGRQAPGTSTPGGAPAGFVEAVGLESGRPVLVVPPAVDVDAVGRRVVVAWNGSPQAARAVDAALPLLREASRVDVVSWARGPAEAPISRLGIAEVLAARGIEATVERRTSSGRVGDELLAAARDRGADLVVMGCYGHGRIAERILGGATRSALRSADVTLLMAH